MLTRALAIPVARRKVVIKPDLSSSSPRLGVTAVLTMFDILER